MKKRTYIVELINNTDRRDDEAVKIKAESSESAKNIAWERFSSRFYIGEAVLARGGTKEEKQIAKRLRYICS